MDCGCGDSDCYCEKFDDWELNCLKSCCIIFAYMGANCTLLRKVCLIAKFLRDFACARIRYLGKIILCERLISEGKLVML